MTKNSADKGKKYINTKEIFAYSFGLFGFQAIVGYINSYQAQFYNNTMGASFMVLAIIMLVAKLISSIADPFLGRVIDRANFKKSKLRPFIIISLVPLAILTLLIFIVVPFRSVTLYIYIFVTFLLWSISMTFAEIPAQGMLTCLSPLPHERNKIAGISNILKNVGLSFSVVVMPVVCFATRSEHGKIYAKEYLITAILITVIGSICFSLIYFFNREKVPTQSNKISTKDLFLMLKNHKPLRLVLLSIFLGFGRSAAMGMQAQAAHTLIGTITVFGRVFSGENAIIILGATCAIASLISMAVTPIINKYLGEKVTFISLAIYGVIITALSFILYALGINSLWFIVISLFFVGLMYGPHSFFSMVMVADCVDYYEWKTGIRAEALHFSVLSFVHKISSALSVALGLAIVYFSGYDSNALLFSDSTKQIIYFGYIMVPGIGCLLSIFPILFYTLVGKEKRKITLELAEMRAKKE